MAALRELTSSWQQHSGVTCVLTVDGPVSGLGDAEKLTVYRIVQECLTNVAKHAHAKKVKVNLVRCWGSSGLADCLELVVADDGVGMGEAAGSDGLGLVGIRERAQMLGGEMNLDRNAGPGTRVVVRLPLPTPSRSE